MFTSSSRNNKTIIPEKLHYKGELHLLFCAVYLGFILPLGVLMMEKYNNKGFKYDLPTLSGLKIRFTESIL